MKSLSILQVTISRFQIFIQTIAVSGMIISLQGCGPRYVSQVPVAVAQVRPVSPYSGAVWIDQGWVWRGGRHVYVPGYYAQPRKGRAYYPGAWKQAPRGHYYVRGRWR